ncbi:MAG: SDR family NAD(P)-dependent oxidoreductase [Steroidobacteraceae bacterium]
MKLQNVAAIVTGGGSGLGKATALALAEAGAKVAVFDLNAQAGETVAHQVRGVFCETNVTADGSVEAAFAKARSAHGQERILINCAGVGSGMKVVSRDRSGAIRQFPADDFNRVIQVNLVGTFRCTAQAAAGMLTLEQTQSGERGVVVNTASIAAEDGQIGQAAYAASKGGIASLTLPLARDLASQGIRVNAVLPGIFDTPLMATVGEKIREALVGNIPFPQRFGEPAEFASLVIEICRNPYFNGENVRLDGALRLGPR